MNHRTVVIVGWTLTIIKILVSFLMMYAGYVTAFTIPLEPDLGYIFSHRWTLMFFGAVFFLSGFVLFLGKVLRKRTWVGTGLASTAACFLFAGILNASAYGWAPEAWLFNFIAALIMAGLWLWWKYKVRLEEYRDLRELAIKHGIRKH